MNSKSVRKKTNNSAPFIGNGNVFADIGRPDADEALAKVQLAHEIAVLIQAAGLTQATAAKRLGIDQPKISALLRGRLAGFSIERLFRFLNELGQDVEISIRPATRKHAAVHVYAAAG
jgi:predicted XRE-type DNA-binding protein